MCQMFSFSTLAVSGSIKCSPCQRQGTKNGPNEEFWHFTIFQGGFGMWLPAQSCLIAKLIKHIIEPAFQPGMGWFGLEEKDHPVATPLPRASFTPSG